MPLDPMPYGQRIYPLVDRPYTPTAQLFRGVRPSTAPSAAGGRTKRPSSAKVLRGRGVKISTVAPKRSGLRQKDGFDLTLTQSSFGELTNLSAFRRDVISRIRKDNSASLDATTGPAAKAKAAKKAALLAKQRAGLTTRQEQEQWTLDGVLLRLRQATERALIGRYGVDMRCFEGQQITVPQFRSTLRMAFGIVLTTPEVGLLVQHFDHDGNGTLDYLEVKAALMTPDRGLVRRMQDGAKSGGVFGMVLAKIKEKASEPPPQIEPGSVEAINAARRRKRKLKKQKALARQRGAAYARDREVSRRPNTSREFKRDHYEAAPDDEHHQQFSLRRVFDAADVDHDGKLSYREFSAVLHKFGLTIDEDAAEAVFHMMDPNGDGSILFDELVWAYFNQHLAQNSGKAVPRAPSRCIAPWVPNATSLASKEAVSVDRRHAYTNSSAPFAEHHHDHLLEASKKNARALVLHAGQRFAQLGATDHTVRRALYSSDNFLGAPRASAMAGGGGVRFAREHQLAPSNRFGPTTFFRDRRPAPAPGGEIAATARPGTA